MNATGFKRLVRALVPQALLTPVERRLFRVRWEGNFPDWAAALAASSGYAAEEITARVTAAARLVREGRARYERDGVAFQEPPAPWPALDFVRGGRDPAGGLKVLDFGGSLGSLYFQNRPQLGDCVPLRWSVVEQPPLAAVGRREFETEELRFYSSLAEACDAGMPDVLLMASVLCYLPAPFVILGELLRLAPNRVVIERTGMVTEGKSHLTVQHVPRSIYRASYPCWFFAREELLAAFAGRYRLVHEARDEVATPAGLEFRSFHFARIA